MRRLLPFTLCLALLGCSADPARDAADADKLFAQYWEEYLNSIR